MSNNKSILGNKGLINLGNTCYMNHTTMFNHLIIFHPNNKNFFNEYKRSNETINSRSV